MIVFGAIAPHGDPAFVQGSSTRTALEELGRRLELAAPDATVVLSPHTVHLEGAFGVATAARIAGSLAVMPMDWGTLIPLWFLGGRAEHPRPVVVVAPARDRPLGEHVRAGAALARACEGRRVALVASADHGHAHDADGPYGFDHAAAEYDESVVAPVRRNRLADALALEPIVEAASADSLWQLAMLHGALGDGFAAELLSYERPTYFGMLCAGFEPAR